MDFQSLDIFSSSIPIVQYQLTGEFNLRIDRLALVQTVASYPVFSKDKSYIDATLVLGANSSRKILVPPFVVNSRWLHVMLYFNAKFRDLLELNIKDHSTYVPTFSSLRVTVLPQVLTLKSHLHVALVFPL